MRKHEFATSLMTALFALPLLAACGGNSVSGPTIEGGLVLPNCQAGDLLYVKPDKSLDCKSVLGSGLAAPNCPSGTALNSDGTSLTCVAKGTGTTNADLSAAINNIKMKTTNLQNQINMFGGGGGAATFCGVTAGSTNGAITSGATKGIAAAAALCQQVAACGSAGHMCSVYEMYESVSAGIITAAMNIPKSWVYMASWNFNGVAGEADPLAGLADNCGSFTYPTGDRKWYGTAVVWNKDTAGDQTLQFFSGPSGASCSSVLPIACCK